MPYAVKEIYYTLQGEGAQAGRAAVFCRFAGCNLWTGREADRGAAVCKFCDTQFVGTDGPGGGVFQTANELAVAICSTWPSVHNPGCDHRSFPTLGLPGTQTKKTPITAAMQVFRPLVVFTGGEPLLQLDSELCDDLHLAGVEIAVETNGTKLAPPGIDWLCVSPKAGSEVVQRSGDELKLIHPQPGAAPEEFADWDFKHFYLQPMDCDKLSDNIATCVDYCLTHPQWKLSLQTHKLLGIP